MIKHLRLTTNIYIKVYPNSFSIKLLDGSNTEKNYIANKDFTTNRLLVGDFLSAEQCLKMAMKDIIPKTLFFSKKPRAIIQPMVMTEGGLSKIEKKIFTELAMIAGVHKPRVYVGAELSDSKAIELINTPV